MVRFLMPVPPGSIMEPLAMTTAPTSLQVEERAIASLKHFSHNARVHSRKQIHQIAASIREFGFTNPVLIDQENVIIAGHGRVEAARYLGLDKVPTIRIEHLTEAQKRAYVLADNKLALNAGWDPEVLTIELQHLSTLDLGFDLEITGFETAEIDLLIDPPKAQTSIDPADQIPEIRSEVVTKPSGWETIGSCAATHANENTWRGCSVKTDLA
jgi:ParB-like chromosome segregation protein Spo0J